MGPIRRAIGASKKSRTIEPGSRSKRARTAVSPQIRSSSFFIGAAGRAEAACAASQAQAAPAYKAKAPARNRWPGGRPRQGFPGDAEGLHLRPVQHLPPGGEVAARAPDRVRRAADPRDAAPARGTGAD